MNEVEKKNRETLLQALIWLLAPILEAGDGVATD